MLNYEAVQARIIPILADAFCYDILGRKMHREFTKVQNELAKHGKS